MKWCHTPSSWWRWPLWKGTVGSGLRRWRCCQTPPPRHRQGRETERETRYKWITNQVWGYNGRTGRPRDLTSPTSISKMRTPSPHQSTARVYEVSVRTSGAKNSGVPQNVLVRSLKPIPEGGDDSRTRWVKPQPDCELDQTVELSVTLFAKSKVSNLYIALRVQEQVVQLQISVRKQGI